MSVYISEFELSENPWRLTWLAELEYPAGRGTEPRIAVCLSELKPQFDDPLSNGSLPWNGPHTVVYIKAGMIALLKIGSVWIKGRRARHLETRSAMDSKRSFTLHHSQFEFFPVGRQYDVMGEKFSLLGGSRYWVGPLFLRVANTWVVCVRRPTDDLEVMIIPCWIIFQHCMASSPKAARRLLMGELDKIVEVSKCDLVPDTLRTYYIKLFKNFRNDEGKTIANLVLDKVAQTEYERMYRTLKVDRVDGDLEKRKNAKSYQDQTDEEKANAIKPPKGPQSHMKCNLPFSEPVTMTVVGKRIAFEAGKGKKQTVWGFLVTDFLQLNVRLGFDTLVIDRKNSGKQGGNADDPDLEDAWGECSGKGVTSPEDVTLTSKPDDPDNALYDLYVEEKVGFDVPGYQYVSEEKAVQRYRSKLKRFLARKASSVGTTGDPASTASNAANVDIESPPSTKIPVTIEGFLQALNFLSTMGHQFATLAVADINMPDQSGQHVVNYLPRSIKGLRSWHLMQTAYESADQRSVPRAYVVARLFAGGVWHYLIDLERKKTGAYALAYIRRHDGQPINTFVIKEFMMNVAKEYGWSGAMLNQRSWVFDAIQHSPTKGHVAFAKKIANKLQLSWSPKESNQMH